MLGSKWETSEHMISHTHTHLIGKRCPWTSERGGNIWSVGEVPLSPLGGSPKLGVPIACSWFQKGEKKKEREREIMKPEAWNVLLEKNHGITSSCGMITMIYEAEVISCDCASGRLVSHELGSQAMRAEEEPHMFNWGWDLPFSRGFQSPAEGEEKLLLSDPWTTFFPPTSSLGRHTALSFSLSF